jgi:DNA-directed RNA polymerase subunit K/omega
MSDDEIEYSDTGSDSEVEEEEEEEENDSTPFNVDIDLDGDEDLQDAAEEESDIEDDEEIGYDNAYIGGGSGDDEEGGEEEEDEDETDETSGTYLQKFNEEIKRNYILDFHPECVIHNYDEVRAFTNVIRDKAGNVVDDLHKTIPYLTKYERTRVIGQRAKQINSGSQTFVKIPETVIDGYLIAEAELLQKKLPFIIRRPTPSGGSEYWNLKDLEIISF